MKLWPILVLCPQGCKIQIMAGSFCHTLLHLILQRLPHSHEPYHYSLVLSLVEQMQDLLQVRKAGAQDNRLCSCLSFKQLEQSDGKPDMYKTHATLAVQQQGQSCFLAGVVNEADDTFKMKWGAPAPTGNASQCRCLCWVCISNSAGPFSSCYGELGSCNNDMHICTHVLCFRFISDVVVRLQGHYALTEKRANHMLPPTHDSKAFDRLSYSGRTCGTSV